MIARPLSSLLTLCFVASSAAALETPIELQPYRVEIVMADGQSDPRSRDELVSELAATSERTWGGCWDLRIESVSAAAWAAERSLAKLTADDLAAELEDADAVDVRYLVWVSPQPAGLSVHVRAWEPSWGHLSPVVVESVYDRRAAPLRILEACRRLFRPRAKWEKHDDQTVRLAVQGAGLAAPDPEFAVTQPREAFTPWMILRNRDGAIQRQQPIGWTYFVADEVSNGRGLARVVSGLRAPHAAKPRGRTELIAVAARPQWPQTRLECAARSQPPRPLAAHRVEWLPVEEPQDSTSTTDGAAAPPRPNLLVTDRTGSLQFSTADHPQMLWASVYSGTLRLARVPLIAGSVPVLRLELPDDAVRLQAEGQLQLLQSELVDVVALRAVTIASARAAAKRSDWQTADEKMAGARRFSAPQQFVERVSAVRVAAQAASLQKVDRTTEQRILQMCDETLELIRRYLDEDRLKLVQEELDELRAAEKQAAGK